MSGPCTDCGGPPYELKVTQPLLDRIARLEAANKRLAGQLANRRLLPGVVQASDLVNGLDALWIAWAERATP